MVSVTVLSFFYFGEETAYQIARHLYHKRNEHNADVDEPSMTITTA